MAEYPSFPKPLLDDNLELALLGAIFDGEPYEEAIAKLSPAHFVGPAKGPRRAGSHAAFWMTLEHIVDTHGRVSRPELFAALHDAKDLVGELSDFLPLPRMGLSVDHMVQKLAELRQRRKVFTFTQMVTEAAARGDGASDLTDLWDSLRDQVDQVQSGRPSSFQPMNELLAETLDDIHERVDLRRSGRALGISTGFKAIDQVMGPLQPDPYLLIGRPGVGKTTLALNIAENVAREGFKVFMFSMEMTGTQLGYKLLSDYSVGSGHMLTGRVNSRQMGRIEERVEDKSCLNFFVNTSPALTVKKMRSLLREGVRQNGKPSLVLVDHANLMDYESQNPVEGLARVSAGMKEFSKTYGCTFLVLTQLSRRGTHEKRPPKLVDIRGSGAWEQDATGVIALYRPAAEAEHPEDIPPDQRDKVQAIILKNRFGGAGTVTLGWNGITGQFCD